MTTIVTYNPEAQNVKSRKLRSVPPQAKVEHAAICSVDGEPWPCRHTRRANNFRMSQWYSVFCQACGKRRNAAAALDIERDLSGHALYFHARKKCAAKAVEWWNENIKPHTGEDLLIQTYGPTKITIGGRSIDDLTRYIARYSKPKAV